MKITLIFVLTVMLALAASCAPDAPIVDPEALETTMPSTALMPSESTALPSTDSPGPAATGTQPAAASSAIPAVTVPPELLGLPQVSQAQADLASRLGAAPADITVVNVEPRTWSDASMGCPDPNMSYAQVPQDGLLVQLAHAGQIYNYHSGGTIPPFLCVQSLTGEKTTPLFGEDVLTRPAP
jgi:hypothetical protein